MSTSTFEQWWASLKNQPIPQLKPTFRECWNAALDAADERCDCNACNFEELYAK